MSANRGPAANLPKTIPYLWNQSMQWPSPLNKSENKSLIIANTDKTNRTVAPVGSGGRFHMLRKCCLARKKGKDRDWGTLPSALIRVYARLSASLHDVFVSLFHPLSRRLDSARECVEWRESDDHTLSWFLPSSLRWSVNIYFADFKKVTKVKKCSFVW